MLRKILDTLDQNPRLKAETALFITFDESGGYFDSGFIQPIDFFEGFFAKLTRRRPKRGVCRAIVGLQAPSTRSSPRLIMIPSHSFGQPTPTRSSLPKTEGTKC
jgi:phosphoesterase family protein